MAEKSKKTAKVVPLKNRKCPTCGAPYLVEKITKRSGHQVCCNNDTCDYARTEEAASA